MDYLILALYSLSLLLIFLFSLGQLHLAWHYNKYKKSPKLSSAHEGLGESYPLVTIQLPVFNEKYVAQRLIDAIGRINYPKDKLEIQVLDDSTDETVKIVREQVEKYRNEGFMIEQIIRRGRTGFKAGALQNGLEMARGEFIAVFDADFIPDKDFLFNTVSYFEDSEIGVVQTRWGHLNKDYSMLTRLQAFGLDAHFTVEQTGRSHAGSFINFNGTGGIWRRTCIEDAGGWSSDTLTEDLDLSYRAQMKGWKFKYLEDVVSPAELPVLMSAIKTQQYRWNKGAAESAVKNLGKVLAMPYKATRKIHAVLHLLNSAIFIPLLFAAVLSIPVLFLKQKYPEFNFLFNVGSIFLLGFLSIGIFYWTSVKSRKEEGPKRYFFSHFPLFLAMSMGLSLHNGLAVIEGFIGHKTKFIRTPKFNVIKRDDSWQGNTYVRPGINWLIVSEGLLGIYFLFGIIYGLLVRDYGLLIFHLFLSFGFMSVCIYSLMPLKNVRT